VPARRLRTRPLVLVVEDDEFSHQPVSSMLINEEIDLEFETDGSTAFDRIRYLAPDMVRMDINLPGFDGVAITQRLKAEPGLALIPVLMLTGQARRETLIRSGRCVNTVLMDAVVAQAAFSGRSAA
jgi:CheY-like chemotaxis protein